MAALPILLAVLVGLAFGALRRGRLRSIARTRVLHVEFLAIAIACSLFVDLSDAGPSGIIALVGLVGGLFFVWENKLLIGMAVIAVGITCNLIPVALNGAMPVRGDALVEAEMVTREELPRVRLNGARELETSSTRLAALGDTYPVRWTGQVLSIGDLIMMVGLANVIANLMLQRRPKHLPESARAALAALGWNEDDYNTDFARLDELSEIDLRDDAVIDLTAIEADAQLSDDAAAASSTTANPVHD